jgi:hypothetical protein
MLKDSQSNYWYDSEIKGIMYIDGKKVIYLKPHVKRLWRYNDHLLEDKMDHINHKRIFLENLAKYYKNIVGVDEPQDNS